MMKKECIAMLLAGGEGKRLGKLTKKLAKPAVFFGGKYRIIDFALSNCTNSGIDTVGVLTQYRPQELNRYIGIGKPWDLDRKEGGVSILPPYIKRKGGDWYKGTADAIYQNIDYIEQYNPEYVLVLSGDHIYKMDYERMLHFHKEQKSDATIAVIGVEWKDVSRFGILSVDDNNKVTQFREKPLDSTSNLASMGVYIYTWKILKHYLENDAAQTISSHDFGKDIIPMMLEDGVKLTAYPFEGYWKDVGTIESLWEANMDLLDDDTSLKLDDRKWRIYSLNPNQPPQYIAASANVNNSLVNEGCIVFGEVNHSILFYGVEVGMGSVINDSVIMPNAIIGENVTIHKAIVGEGTIIGDLSVVGSPDSDKVTLVGNYESLTSEFLSVKEQLGI
ncbi:glucose-1-phosphate adenylyltransferase [Paenibacillus crassostreae]|uniref:Glucose-1-phosphate adenylyltransferase n=1 Tax=Paenibacillus crassostreae TaxID=1763538 RepID=A0A167G2E7_9BACL|nr:glucose-1-phosphate adenylyltransferase [Paenibacillus crassostreae]AOZ93827.1 glucose-1-phosphate adenylyltransferase [Paenibacillus crassostreae]OAB77140.1 glucose-1-phosphate adenylyltransferase [Paenibacillus crassostreae]